MISFGTTLIQLEFRSFQLPWRREQGNKGRKTGDKGTQRCGKRENRVQEAGSYDPSVPPPSPPLPPPVSHTNVPSAIGCHKAKISFCRTEIYRNSKCKCHYSHRLILNDSLPQVDLDIKLLSSVYLFYLLDVLFSPLKEAHYTYSDGKYLVLMKSFETLLERISHWNILVK